MNFQQQNDCQPRKSLAVPIFLERKGLQQRCVKLTWLLPADNVDDGHKHQDTSVSATTYADLARNITDDNGFQRAVMCSETVGLKTRPV